MRLVLSFDDELESEFMHIVFQVKIADVVETARAAYKEQIVSCLVNLADGFVEFHELVVVVPGLKKLDV